MRGKDSEQSLMEWQVRAKLETERALAKLGVVREELAGNLRAQEYIRNRGDLAREDPLETLRHMSWANQRFENGVSEFNALAKECERAIGRHHVARFMVKLSRER